MKYCFVFVCQAGELEIKSTLLAASLKRYLKGDYECVAAIPQPVERWGEISKSTQNMLNLLGIRRVPIVNPIDDNYPIGNKVACLGIETPAERIIFLDTDILCLRTFLPEQWFNAHFSAKPADLATLTHDIFLWQRMYSLFQLSFPPWRLISSVSGELMIPYFNAGVIVVQNHLGFAKAWAECCRLIDAQESIPQKRPWLDQFALSITVMKLNLSHHCLDERFNYPAHLKPLPESLPFFCHYHWPSVIRREPHLTQLVNELAETYPLIKQSLLASPEWSMLLKPYALKKNKKWFFRPWTSKKFLYRRVDALITGIPRSGTSHLCRLLHTLPDCIAINEPPQIFHPLMSELYPWKIPIFYQEIRRDILEGRAIENKVHEGQLIEDTSIIDVRNPYHPQVSRPDFLLVTKNTLAYLARLSQLKRVLPHAPIIACIRHPLDTIASWKTSFPHLKHAQVNDFPVGHVNDPILSSWQRQRLKEIATTPNEAVKRALLWRYLVEVMSFHSLILVRYEQLVTQPSLVLKHVLHHIPDAPCRIGNITASTIRHKREVLDHEDIQAIYDICSQSAAELGYDMASSYHSSYRGKNTRD